MLRRVSYYFINTNEASDLCCLLKYSTVGSEGNNLKWFLEKSLLNFPSSKKTFLINNSIKSRDSQIHLL